MNKKLIKLTESDLHRIVKESVNKILTEMDWKTYRSAEDKVREQVYELLHNRDFKDIINDKDLFNKLSKLIRRQNSFGEAARNALKDKFGEGNLDMLIHLMANGNDNDKIVKELGRDALGGLPNELNKFDKGGYRYKAGSGWRRNIRKNN